MNFMMRHDGKILIAILLGVLLLIISSTKRHNENRELCHQKGGAYFSTRDGSICLKKEVVIDL